MSARARLGSLIGATLIGATLAAAALVGLAATAASAQSVGEHINSYDVSIQIERDGSLLVVERIDYDFDSFSRHGIFRGCPGVVDRDRGVVHRRDRHAHSPRRCAALSIADGPGFSNTRLDYRRRGGRRSSDRSGI